MVTLGNHEYDHGTSKLPGWNASYEWCASWDCVGYSEDSGGDCGLPYRRRFRMPEGASSAGSHGRHRPSIGREPSAKGLGPMRMKNHRALAAETINEMAAAGAANKVGPMDGFKSWYSVDVGTLHLAVVTVEMDFTNGSVRSESYPGFMLCFVLPSSSSWSLSLC